jgi:DNA-binding NarL/FixJ family response regulator
MASPSAVPLTVFIADDSPPVAEMLKELLTDPGRVEVIGVAETETAAIESIERLRPDVVVLDLQLKTGSGTDVIRAVRANEQLADIRLLVTTNHASPELKAGCLELGADDYFDKLKELGALARRVRELADRKAGGRD